MADCCIPPNTRDPYRRELTDLVQKKKAERKRQLQTIQKRRAQAYTRLLQKQSVAIDEIV